MLFRAMASVRAQDYAGPLEHVIVIDECEHSRAELETLDEQDRKNVLVRYEKRMPGEIPASNVTRNDIYMRQARMLNKAARHSDAHWIAFLDDDNEFEPNHVSSLVDCARRADCSAVHSHCVVLNSDGSPYLEQKFPWALTEDEKTRIYELLCQRGVWSRNSNILRDRAGPRLMGPFRNSTKITEWDPVYLVDTSAWFVENALLQRYPIPEVFTERDREENNAWDDKFLELLLDNRVRIATNGLPTLRYYLGGISNV